MSEHAPLSGTCLCGAVHLRVAKPAGWLGVCHCAMCQRWSGGIWAGFPADAADVIVRGPVKAYASSALAERAFCAECGTQLWMRNREDGAPYDLMPGIFEETKNWPLKSEIYVDEAYAAYALKGDHKRADAQTYRDKNPEVIEVQHG